MCPLGSLLKVFFLPELKVKTHRERTDWQLSEGRRDTGLGKKESEGIKQKQTNKNNFLVVVYAVVFRHRQQHDSMVIPDGKGSGGR